MVGTFSGKKGKSTTKDDQQSPRVLERSRSENLLEGEDESRDCIRDASVFANVWGKWPGDESIEELLRLLKKEQH